MTSLYTSYMNDLKVRKALRITGNATDVMNTISRKKKTDRNEECQLQHIQAYSEGFNDGEKENISNEEKYYETLEHLDNETYFYILGKSGKSFADSYREGYVSSLNNKLIQIVR